MPIVVQCGACSARLSVPDLAAGKNVKCPKCQTPIAVSSAADAEGFEVVESPPTPVRTKPVTAKPVRVPETDDELLPKRKLAKVADDNNDFENEDDDRPRKKKQPPKVKSKAALIVIGAIVVLFLGCGGILALGYKLMQDTQELAKNGGLVPQPNGAVAPVNTPIAKNNPIATVPAPKLPAGWEKFNDPLGEINLYFPTGQPTKNDAASATITQKSGGNAADVWTLTSGKKIYTLVRTTLPDAEVKGKNPERILDEAARGVRGNVFGAHEESSSTAADGSKPGRVVTVRMLRERTRLFARIILSGNRMIVISATGDLNTSMTDAEIQPYIDNLHVLK